VAVRTVLADLLQSLNLVGGAGWEVGSREVDVSNSGAGRVFRQTLTDRRNGRQASMSWSAAETVHCPPSFPGRLALSDLLPGLGGGSGSSGPARGHAEEFRPITTLYGTYRAPTPRFRSINLVRLILSLDYFSHQPSLIFSLHTYPFARCFTSPILSSLVLSTST
jgi:hypothetical protein